MWNKILIYTTVGILFVGCASKKSTVTKSPNNSAAVSNTSREDFAINNLDFRTFSGRAKSKVEFGSEKQDVTLHMRVQRNKAIWISVTATFLNYEAARVLITPDSIKILNKLNSEYTAKPFSYIQRYTGAGVSFNVLQDLLLSNVSQDLLRTDQLTVAKAADDVQIVGVKNDLSFQYSLTKDYRPKVFRLTPVGASESLEAFYSSFNAITGYNFPQKQNISLSTNSLKINAVLDYNKVEFNQELEMPFTVPSKYRVIN